MSEYNGEVKRPKFKGVPTSRQQKRSKERRGNVDTSKMNAGGFYEGMPGCHLDQYGNRMEILFVVTPEGKSTSQIFAHPKHVKICIEKAMSNPMIKGIVYSAVTDDMFRNKTIWNLPIRLQYRFMMWNKSRKTRKKQKQMLKQIENEKAKEQSAKAPGGSSENIEGNRTPGATV